MVGAPAVTIILSNGAKFGRQRNKGKKKPNKKGQGQITTGKTAKTNTDKDASTKHDKTQAVPNQSEFEENDIDEKRDPLKSSKFERGAILCGRAVQL